MAVKRIKLGNTYTITSDTVSRLTGADKLGLKLGDEIDAGDGRFMLDDCGDLRLIEPLRALGTSGLVACPQHLTKSGKHQLQVGDTVTVKELSSADKYPHYHKDVSNLDTIDVYQVLDLFNVTNPCLQHIVKKALVTGGRTAGKDFSQDLREIRDTAIRAVEMDEQANK